MVERKNEDAAFSGERNYTLKLKETFIVRKIPLCLCHTCLSVSTTHSIGLLASFGQSVRILCVVCILSTKHSDTKTSQFSFFSTQHFEINISLMLLSIYVYFILIIYYICLLQNRSVNIKKKTIY